MLCASLGAHVLLPLTVGYLVAFPGEMWASASSSSLGVGLSLSLVCSPRCFPKLTSPLSHVSVAFRSSLSFGTSLESIYGLFTAIDSCHPGEQSFSQSRPENKRANGWLICLFCAYCLHPILCLGVERMDPWFAAKIVGVFTLKTEAKRKMRLEEFFLFFCSFIGGSVERSCHAPWPAPGSLVIQSVAVWLIPESRFIAHCFGCLQGSLLLADLNELGNMFALTDRFSFFFAPIEGCST
jgi:hypothetical protein